MRAIQLSALNLNLLGSLDALLQTGSLTEAAARQRVTPSAMSHSLRQLRGLLDDPLLVRQGQRMRLTPAADALRDPLHRAILELGRAVALEPGFDPTTDVRRFVIAAPDFVADRLIGTLASEAARWPGLMLDVVPSNRLGNAAGLDAGTLDLALGAVIPAMPRIERLELYEERFVCIVARDHPARSLDLEAFCAWPHGLVGLDDHYDPRTSWVDLELAARSLSRRVAFRSRYFVGLASAVAGSELVATVPLTLARWAAERWPLRVLEPPLSLPAYQEVAMWHERMSANPAHCWLRERVAELAKAHALRYGGP